jgi:hypothetical protein
LSNDGGVSFKSLPPQAASPPLDGSITVAFDPEFSRNKAIYAASNTADEGIYRLAIDKNQWESIDSCLPAGSMVSQLVVAADDTLYAANFKSDGGMERCLDPAYSLGPTFETVIGGLDEGATLSGLWLSSNRLWTIDSHNIGLMAFTDSLTQPVTLTSPSNKAQGIGLKNINLEWKAPKGATTYQWQLDNDTNFSTIPTGFEGETKASSARLSTLETATTYYWRVRATKPVLSPWSNKWSFTTSLGREVTAPQLLKPRDGASGVPLEPLFQWSAVTGAESYELVVSTEPSLANPTIALVGASALTGTAWQCSVSLNYDTAYYWKVRAASSGSFSDWSVVGVFTTEPPPSPPPSSSPPNEPTAPTPPPNEPTASTSPPPLPPLPAQPTTPDWAIYLMGLLGLIIILLLTVILVLVMRLRHI